MFAHECLGAMGLDGLLCSVNYLEPMEAVFVGGGVFLSSSVCR